MIIVEMIEKMAKENPDSIALALGNTCLSYKELNQKANQIADYLLSLDIRPQSYIATFLNVHLI